jgi:hypothetical protein
MTLRGAVVGCAPAPGKGLARCIKESTDVISNCDRFKESGVCKWIRWSQNFARSAGGHGI